MLPYVKLLTYFDVSSILILLILSSSRILIYGILLILLVETSTFQYLSHHSNSYISISSEYKYNSSALLNHYMFI